MTSSNISTATYTTSSTVPETTPFNRILKYTDPLPPPVIIYEEPIPSPRPMTPTNTKSLNRLKDTLSTTSLIKK